MLSQNNLLTLNINSLSLISHFTVFYKFILQKDNFLHYLQYFTKLHYCNSDGRIVEVLKLNAYEKTKESAPG